MRSGGPGSIPGADNLESGFHPFGLGKRWSRLAYAAGGAHYHSYLSLSLRLARVTLEVVMVSSLNALGDNFNYNYCRVSAC